MQIVGRVAKGNSLISGRNTAHFGVFAVRWAKDSVVVVENNLNGPHEWVRRPAGAFETHRSMLSTRGWQKKSVEMPNFG